MKLYQVVGLFDHVYFGKRDEAHKHLKVNVPKGERDTSDGRIELVEVPTDQANLLRILNDQGGFQSAPLRTWKLTARGGLKEIPNGE